MVTAVTAMTQEARDSMLVTAFIAAMMRGWRQGVEPPRRLPRRPRRRFAATGRAEAPIVSEPKKSPFTPTSTIGEQTFGDPPQLVTPAASKMSDRRGAHQAAAAASQT